ncbi:uncharacterized protein BDZ99DRAFT_390476 [Mytilinidion resinicola]|uniref:Polysaccharide synthase Cps1p n=1 Tax=Mytilinidion resinicola TaxID=574789 RepID=A0A6A6YJJ6_9PEZI|nr:uncharacterized protein BDZ99DRAFT_390476 [Mytilinidion resinicola]KAF2808164.1 hypothetical protein BDZ99DRAFT_390476 [Mytilinidion resinicola]
MYFAVPLALPWSWVFCFALLFLFRYLRLHVNLLSLCLYRPVQPSDDPSVTSRDMTVIIPTVAVDIPQLRDTLGSALLLDAYEIFLVTTDACFKRVSRMVEDMGSPKKVRMLSVAQANKRRQMSRAIPEVQTRITLLLDDDVWLPEKFTKWILAPFEDERVGGAGTNQRLRRKDPWNIWEFLGASYLVRRNFDCTACNYMDGGLPCLSGRAVAYRSEILQDPHFTHGFNHETWRRGHFLNADDDNFITRWLFTHDWKIKFQNHRECEVETTLENDSKYLKQCLRWVRSNWRSNITSLKDGNMWRKYPWSLYAVFQTTVTQWAFLYDVLLFWTFNRTLADLGCDAAANAWRPGLLWALFAAHYLFSKTIKYIPHLLRNPGDIMYLPVSILFGFYHNTIKFQGLLTLKETTWGTREGADQDDDLRMIPIKPPVSPPPEGRVLRERGAILPTATTATTAIG